jgi:hypothetical protein
MTRLSGPRDPDRLVKRIVDILPVTDAGITLISSQLNPRYS